jgi:hypothetical protein
MRLATKREELALASSGLGCLGKAADDEPVFVLRAQDINAPQVVEEWVRVTMITNARLHRPFSRVSAKIEEALELTKRMRDWQSTHITKVPD